VKRDTQQRKSILKAIINARRPLSVNEVFELARRDVAALGIATVYRNIKSLQAEGQIVEVELPGQPPHWEIAPENHHHHFLCRNCEKIFEIKDCLGDFHRLLPAGYTLEEHDLLLRGICKTCNKAKPKKSKV
jgi:Fur family transcriptional regulator, ferric uptake regulator